MKDNSIMMCSKKKMMNKPKRYSPPPDQICANCGATVPGSDLALLSQAIHNHKPVCSYECNKALKQID